MPFHCNLGRLKTERPFGTAFEVAALLGRLAPTNELDGYLSEANLPLVARSKLKIIGLLLALLDRSASGSYVFFSTSCASGYFSSSC